MVVSYPIPPYSNVPIEPQYYQPSAFDISGIVLGATTIVTTAVNHNYVIGQEVRLLIPAPYGSIQLNGVSGFVIAIPAANQVQININSTQASAFDDDPFSATISGATNAEQCVLTVSEPVWGPSVFISGVGGMTQLNGTTAFILFQTATTITLAVNSIAFSVYTSGGTVSTYPPFQQVAQIIAIGDINSGQININAMLETTYIPGSFINIG
jgi:hypothetical protein